MDVNEEAFLESVTNVKTRREYKHTLNKFCRWFGKSPAECLKLREQDLTPKDGESLMERKFRASRFEKEIERFHGALINKGETVNTAARAHGDGKKG
jgi:hypothetical protein